MPPVVYRNTQTTLPGWVNTVHESEPRGFAYETETHFVHFYGRDSGIWVISTGLTATQAKQGTLANWVTATFGAQGIAPSTRTPGQTIAGVWRPGITNYDDIRQGLSTTDSQRHAALQTVRLLLERLDELFLYIEPSATSLTTYSHKTRELLILACTEVENAWKQYMREANAVPANNRDYTTQDYVKLLAPLYLAEFELALKPYPVIAPVRPFHGWSASQPSKSLVWYDGYNLTKHDRQTHFDKATLKNCIDAVCANLVLFSVRFSPYPLYQEGGTVSALFGQLFEIALRDCSPDSFYLPLVKFPDNFNPNLICFDCVREKLKQPWFVQPLAV